ncbi:hypothetical protein [Acidovorax sp. Leaf160]|uniref:hypothetical protein n=1 Tax=Acidovorax sp. Leaf160 TaxID=1736280 RepID=UPI0012E3CC22|nr:hypothetical protein [Acidovorax sp. Leaf160]
MEALKTRMEATKQELQQAQTAPQDQRATILAGTTGENLTGDLLTATVGGYFASLQSHGAIASSQAQTFDLPALSYGLFHAQVKPNKLYGIVATGISFQGLNMDIGHLRHIRWVKDDNPSSPISTKAELTTNGRPAAQNTGLPTTRCESSAPAPWNTPCQSNTGWTKPSASTRMRTARHRIRPKRIASKASAQ